jgi:tetratricopeptide (TPR) repeat protein
LFDLNGARPRRFIFDWILLEGANCLNPHAQCRCLLSFSLLIAFGWQALSATPLKSLPAGRKELLVCIQSATAPTQDPAILFSEGAQALKNGEFSRAEEFFRQVLALDPKSGAAHINLGVTYMRQRRWADALAELHQAETLSRNVLGIQLNIGLIYYRKGDFDAAIEPFSRVLKLEPDSLQASYLLGLCYFFTNRYKAAVETLTPLWRQESTNLNYLYVLSIAANKSSNAPLQKQAFDQMIAIGQNTPEFHLYAGKAWLAGHDTDQALEQFQMAAAAKPNLPLVHYFLGRTYLERYAYTEAEAELKRDASIEPEFAYDYEDLGLLYVKLGQMEKAEASFRRAIELNHELVNSYFGLAKLYRDAVRYNDALEMLDHAEALAPQSASIHYTRGQVLTHLGQREQAHQEFETAAKLLKSFNDRLQQDPSGDRSADAQNAAQQ